MLKSAQPFPTHPVWLWTKEQQPNQTLLLRWQAECPDDAEELYVQITANTRYNIWTGGRYTAQGPGAAAWPECAVDTLPIQLDSIKAGKLSLSVLAHWYGVRSQSHPLGRPGLWMRLLIKSEGKWLSIEPKPADCKLLRQGGWREEAARRTWATGWTEQFDASCHPHGWVNPDFDDSTWSTPSIVERDEIQLVHRETPYLQEWEEPVSSLIMACEVTETPDLPGNCKGLTRHLDETPWRTLPKDDLASYQKCWANDQGIVVEAGQHGLALCFDLGHEVSGQPEFEVETEDGLVDCYGAEIFRNGRPMAYKEDGEYANRWWGAPGADRFRTMNYNGFRYLLIVLRPGKSRIKLRHLSVWRRQAQLPNPPSFQCTDPELQKLWDISIRTLQVSTQETPVDCPTREQSLYIGDGVWNALWMAELFNEPRYFSHLLRSIAKIQHPNGLFPSALFASMEPPQYLIDYCLIFALGIDVYRQYSGDNSLVRKVLPAAEKTLEWFQVRISVNGLLETEPKIMDCHPGGRIEIAFIDHPGVGWHSFPHPGIERSTLLLGMNAFLAMAIEAFQSCAEAVGYETKLNADFLNLDRLRRTARKYFWNETVEGFADCIDREGKLAGWSEQSQALATIAGFMSPETARRALERVLSERNSGKVCRCTPYFWIYLEQAMRISGLEDRIIPLMREDWSKMTCHEWTTTCWETFEGTGGDTFCHPWSALPAWVLHQVGSHNTARPRAAR